MDQTQILLMFTVNLVVIIGGVWKGIMVLISVRDEIRDLVVKVGTKVPPEGLLGDVETLKREFRPLRDSLVEVTMELGLRPPGGRT